MNLEDKYSRRPLAVIAVNGDSTQTHIKAQNTYANQTIHAILLKYTEVNYRLVMSH